MAKPINKRESSFLSERKWCNLYCDTATTRNLKRFYKKAMNKARRMELNNGYLYETEEEKESKEEKVIDYLYGAELDDYYDELWIKERAWLFYESGVQDLRENKSLINVYKF